MDEVMQELLTFVDIQVKAGYESREMIINQAIDMLIGEYDMEWLEENIMQMTDTLLAEHQAEQRLWGANTDCDKLDEAFATLDRLGIVARQNFSCCQTCGHVQINDEIEQTSLFRPVRGYVFFHEQDTETVVTQGHLYLAYGAVSGKAGESEQIANEIVQILEIAGLDVYWEGTIHKRIRIQNMQWNRRR